MPNWSQISGVVERVVWVVITWLVAKGYITQSDAANLVTLVVGIAAAIYAYYVNRNVNLAKQAASIPGTTVITDAAIADNTVNPSIMSNVQVKATMK